LVTNLSSEVSTWFIDDSSEETSSSISSSSSSSVSSCYESKKLSSPPSSSESCSLFLTAEVSTTSSNMCLPLLSLDAILLTRESVGRERVIGGGRDHKCRVGDGSGTGTYIYLLMEQRPMTVSAWSWRTKRHRFHFIAHAPDHCFGQDKKGTCPLQPLVLCF
jgi:hypothetical protein